MVIDQRNAGASVTPTVSTAYTLDRWAYTFTQASKASIQQNAGSVTLPAGFSNYLGLTSLSAYSVLSTDNFTIGQFIEGYNFSDLAWGTASAKTVTLSFLVYSSLTGTFGGALANSAASRSYPFTYTISSASTWTTVSVTIPGDTTGTWIGGTNGIGLRLWLSVGCGSTFSGTAGAWAGADYRSATGATSVVGTSGATFYITGVQLEQGSVATPFERPLYSKQLADCQRYCYVVPKNTYMGNVGQCYSTTQAQGTINLPVTMRTSPALTAITDFTGFNIYSSTASTIQLTSFAAATTADTESFFWGGSVSSGLIAGNATILQKSPTNVPLIFSAEL
jgi:hypothetical protein